MRNFIRELPIQSNEKLDMKMNIFLNECRKKVEMWKKETAREKLRPAQNVTRTLSNVFV
jgi:hypothetical protein